MVNYSVIELPSSSHPTAKISQEAYNSYEKAVRFCENRADNPTKIDDYNWKPEQYKYTIIELKNGSIKNP